jgi:hypothetical protein
MALHNQRTQYRFVPAAYSLGLAVIFSATVLNLCLHRLPAKHLYLLPDILTERYDRAGNLGVTTLLVGIGGSLIMVGVIGSYLSGRSSRTGGRGLADCPTPNTPMSYSDPGLITPSDARASSGTMVLQTMKYMGAKPSALPGATVMVEQ